MRISDWSSDVCSSDLNYIARTPDIKSKLVVKAQGAVAAGSEFQVDSLETGWSSGRQTLKDGAAVELTLSKMGDNEFQVFVLDPSGAPIALENDKIGRASWRERVCKYV